MITVSVLGSVELHRDGERIPVRKGKTTEVLIRLALEAGDMVRTERLIEDLWVSEAAGTARNTLQTTVSRLRRALGDPALVTGTSTGYTLNSSQARSTRWKWCDWPSSHPRFAPPGTTRPH